MTVVVPATPAPDLEAALADIAQGAGARDAGLPAFPTDALHALVEGGALAANAVAGHARPPAASELGLVRAVAAADGSVGRILDGHLNAVERLAVHAPDEIRDEALRGARAGELWLGVWGGRPEPGEGSPAEIRPGAGGDVLRGVATFCSGAGGLDRALVLAGDASRPGAPPVFAFVDVAEGRHVSIDETWFQARGLVASVSHRVVFADAPVRARIGEPGAVADQPWFARDALRTAATWAGMADSALHAALARLRARVGSGTVEALAAGRMLTHRHTIDAVLRVAADAMDDAGPELPAVALHGRAAIADACRGLLDEAARACGAHPFVRADPLDRARRDLEVFLLQHRLDPLLARAGEDAIA